MEWLDWLSVHWLAGVLLIAYTAMLLHHARLGSRATRGVADFYVGGRNIGGVVVGVSFFATFASTNSYVGNAGKAYAYGAPWMVMAVMMVVATALSWLIVAPRLRRFTTHWDALTLPDYLTSRFPAEHERLRVLSAVVIVFSSLLYLVAIFKGAGNLFQTFLGVSYASAVGLTLVIVVGYTAIGGFVSVVRTDLVQGVLMLIGSVLIFTFVTRAAGGVGVLAELSAQTETEHLFRWNGGIPFVVLLGIALSGSLKLMVDPRQVSRFFALRDARSVRVGMWVSVFGIAFIMGMLFPVGLYARALLDGVSDTDLVVPLLVSDPSVFPIAVSDFLIVAMVAAAMSSMDSVLLVAASVLTRDLLRQRDPNSGTTVRATRVSVVSLAVVAAVVALNPPGGIVEVTTFSGSLYAVCFLPAILLGLHWRRGEALGVMWSMIAGIVCLLGWLALGLRDIAHEVFPALVVSLCMYVWFAYRRVPALGEWPR